MVFWNPKKRRTTAKPKTTASISKPKVGSVKQELNILPQPKKTDNPKQDFLGSIFMELNLGDKSNSQFFTPYHVCELMAKVTEEDVAAVVKEKGYITINDFCCGAGATLIAAINEARKQLEKVNLNFQNHVLVVAQDIDEIVALMCYIQLSLLGVAAYIKVGDVFTQPMSTDDNGENYWFTMMYFSDVWTMRRVFHSL